MTEETNESVENEYVTPPVMVGLHPLGGIRVDVRGADGTVASARVDLPDATMLVKHLDALINMTFQAIYAQHAVAAQEANQLWTP